MARRASGGRIDRTRPIRFRFNGRSLTGFAGDTLASALVAGDVRLVGRSFKYHRPRGIVGAGEDEPNAIFQLGTGARSEANLRATRVELFEGLEASSVNCWPGVGFDLGAIADRLHRVLPAGFYYKTFMGGPRWPFWEPWIRRAAGLGRVSPGADPDRYLKRHAHCDMLVIGGGPFGLAEARAAAASGARVILADDQPELGGSLLWTDPAFDPAGAAAGLVAAGVTVLRRTTVFGYYDHNQLVAIERVADHLPPGERGGLPRQRIWHIRARQVVVAAGALERPLLFPDNDRPGVMLASAARQYARRWAAMPGRRAVVVTNNDSAYEAAFDLREAGMEIAAIVDLRARPAAFDGAPVHAGSVIQAVRGTRGVRGVRLAKGEEIACDCVLMSGGWTPTVHLFSQSGGRLRWDEGRDCFLPDASPQAVRAVGGAAGDFGDLRILPHRRIATARRQWVDFQSDVTDHDVALAARENFVSVELFKRYTTTGMSTDQGKTSNLNALALLGVETGRAPAEVGTTRFRPPFAPVTMSAIAAGASGDLLAPRRLVPAHAAHRALGAHIEDFGGWQRPEYYPREGESAEDAARREHLAVRNAVGLFESSPIGKIEVIGRDAAAFLHTIYVNAIVNLPVGGIRYGLMLNENGVITDDGVCARLGPDRFLVSPTSGAAARITAWLEEWRQCEYPALDIHIADVTTAWAAFAVAGPRAREVVARLSPDMDLSPAAFPHMTLRTGHIAGIRARVMRVSFSGELQFEIQVPASYGEALWRRLLEAGADLSIAPIGIEAWLRLRIEKGYIHVGSDTDGTTVPDDVGLGAPIRRKVEDFVGRRSLNRPAVLRDDREQLVGLRTPQPNTVLPVGACAFLGERFAPPMQRDGRVTSSCFSPVLDAPIALAMIRRGRSRIGERIKVWSQGSIWEAEICSPVFYDPGNERLHG